MRPRRVRTLADPAASPLPVAFSLFCLVQYERAKARAADVYQDGLRWRWVQEERRRRELRRDAALTLWKAAW